MKLFLDCEWNGEGGELISLALVPIKTYRPPFYGALPLPVQIDPWVKDHARNAIIGTADRAEKPNAPLHRR